MNSDVFYIMVGIGILDIIIKLIPWGSLTIKRNTMIKVYDFIQTIHMEGIETDRD